jgi:CIC family chloride channel protein
MSGRPSGILGRFLVWRVKHVSHRQFILILSIIVGIASGLAAVLIKSFTHWIYILVQGRLVPIHTYFYLLTPAIGILLTLFVVKYITKTPPQQGIPATLFAISKRNGIIPRNRMFSAILTSALTVGFGGSAGLEGPTVSTGTAAGSNIARWMHLNYRNRILMIGCAAAGTMAAIFKAPIAAIVFAIEVFMLDLTMASLVPLLLSSVAAVLTSYAFTGDDYIIPFIVQESFSFSTLPFYVLLGVITAFASAYFSNVFFYFERFFSRFKNNYTRWIIGGLLLGVLVFLFPPLYGEGFNVINALLAGNSSSLLENSLFEFASDRFLWVAGFLLLVGLLKIVATSITFGAGGVGGIFAPTLFMGSVLGYFFSFVLQRLTSISFSTANFTLVGMAGMMAGVLHAPLTAIFLIAELTGGYQLFVPLMITATISYAIARAFNPHSVYTLQLAQRGELLTHHKDKVVLSRMQLNKLLENNFLAVFPDMTLGEMVKIVSQSKRNIFPVTDQNDFLLGVITLDDIREIMFDHKLYDSVKVSDMMRSPSAVVDMSCKMDDIMDRFNQPDIWNIAVVDRGVYKGFVSKSKLFTAYRRMLMEFSED